jgi:hypothetical protein
VYRLPRTRFHPVVRQRDARQDQGSGEKCRGLFYFPARIFEAVMMGHTA